ncbi:MAG: hypothetical protein IJR44_06785 [Neisseriaceae bacterium]|nr:hypothetical protein [Neisseriaceae bacterium]MBQ9620178.1 hypothetical protein [Neisseriaceae bacterium]
MEYQRRRTAAQIAADFNRRKLATGEYRQITLMGRSEALDTIDRAVQITGKSRVQGLWQICQEWIDAQNSK